MKRRKERLIGIFLHRLKDGGMKRGLEVIDLVSDGGSIDIERSVKDEVMERIEDGLEKGILPERIIGRALFLGRVFDCPEQTLVPTRDTEIMVERCIDILKEQRGQADPPMVLDIGTGCGNIAISIALGIGDAVVHATDIVPEALEVVRRNSRKFNVSERVTTHEGSLYSPLEGSGLEGSFDLIVCNPPYIPSSTVDNLPEIVKDNQPRAALDAGPFGMDIIRGLLAEAHVWLKRSGHLLFEIGEGQERLVKRTIERSGPDMNFKEGYYEEKVRYFECVIKG